MAGSVPVVSTAVGAEGLEVHPPDDCRIADSPEAFAADCLQLPDNPELGRRMAERARQLVCSRFSWDQVARAFEAILEETRPKVRAYRAGQSA